MNDQLNNNTKPQNIKELFEMILKFWILIVKARFLKGVFLVWEFTCAFSLRLSSNIS